MCARINPHTHIVAVFLNFTLVTGTTVCRLFVFVVYLSVSLQKCQTVSFVLWCYLLMIYTHLIKFLWSDFDKLSVDCRPRWGTCILDADFVYWRKLCVMGENIKVYGFKSLNSAMFPVSLGCYVCLSTKERRISWVL